MCSVWQQNVPSHSAWRCMQMSLDNLWIQSTARIRIRIEIHAAIARAASSSSASRVRRRRRRRRRECSSIKFDKVAGRNASIISDQTCGARGTRSGVAAVRRRRRRHTRAILQQVAENFRTGVVVCANNNPISEALTHTRRPAPDDSAAA